MDFVKEKVETAQVINDVGLKTDGEHGIVVKNERIVLWFSAETFKINV